MSGPVFVFSAHRAGSTLLARVLNCHPEMVIWGEHAGFINRLAEIDAVAGRYNALTTPLAERGLDIYAGGGKSHPLQFDPWASPFSRDGFRAWCRGFIDATLRQNLHPGQRWGFKEIRYHSVATARFLAELFPDGRFVILRRDLTRLALSNLFAPWSRDVLRWTGALASETEIAAAVTDCAYALVAIDTGLQAIAEALPERCHLMTHDAIEASPLQHFVAMFLFLGLRGSPTLQRDIEAVIAVRVGASDGASEGHLSVATVMRYLPNALAAARAEIAAHGPDLARLRRLGERGRYSLLAGDHNLLGTPYSGLF
jgi:hypothetical protein